MNFKEKEKLIQVRAAALFEENAVDYIIGFGATRYTDKTRARFVRTADEAKDLVYNEYCTQSLAKYLTDDRWPEGKIAILARGCESRAINRMIKDNQIDRDNLVILGIPCEGTSAERCSNCRVHDPVIYDELLWEPGKPDIGESSDISRYKRAAEVESLSGHEKKAYWEDVYARCIRCYACRNACPVCTCRECFVDMHRTGFQGKRHTIADNQTFGITRAFHVGDRCIECGECERACPMGLPILAQTQKILKEIEALAGDYEQGMDPIQDNFLGAFDLDDKDDFM